MKTIILGLGNSILTDDSAGLKIAAAVRALLTEDERQHIHVAENERGGMDVVDAIASYDRAVIVDAVRTGTHPPGTIHRYTPETLPFSTRRLAGLHDLNIRDALELARRLDLPVPGAIDIVAVEIEDDIRFGETCTPDVRAAIPGAALVVLALARSAGSARPAPFPPPSAPPPGGG